MSAGFALLGFFVTDISTLTETHMKIISGQTRRLCLRAAGAFATVVLALASVSAASHWQEKDKGVSFDVPDGFTVRQEMVKDKTFAAFGPPPDAKIPPRSNVTIATQKLPPGAHFTLQQAAEGVRQSEVGVMKVGAITDAKLGETDAKTWTAEVDGPEGVKFKVRQTLCLAHGQLFLVTATSTVDSSDAFAKLLEPMLASFKFPDPQ